MNAKIKFNLREKRVWSILILLMFFVAAHAQSGVYIDASAGEGGNGTQANPFNDITDVSSWNANTTYYLKRGENYYITKSIDFSKDNMVLDAYGSGSKPRVWTDKSFTLFKTSAPGDDKPRNVTVRNILFENTRPADCYNETANVLDMQDCIDPVLENVQTRGGGRGINGARVDGTYKILNCKVTNTDDDGCWFYHCDVVYIDGLVTDSINRGRLFNCGSLGKKQTGGDCVQYVNDDKGPEHEYKLIIKNSILDRTPYEWKFNIMVGSYSGNRDAWPSLHLENVEMYHSGEGSNIYTNECDSIIIDKCLFDGSLQGIYKGYTMPTHYVITRSVFRNHTNYNLWLQINNEGNTLKAYNNVFTGKNMKSSINLYGSNATLKNNVWYDVDKVFYSSDQSNITSSHNNYYKVGDNYPTNESNAIYADPKFVNANAGNFYLTPGSPLINKGTPVNIGKTDMDGTAIPQNGGWDIGAYEFDGEHEPAENQKPVAVINGKEEAFSGDIIQLDGSDSYDPEGSSLTYLWAAPSKIKLSSYTSQKVTFTAPNVEDDQNFQISLLVNDGELASEFATFNVTIKDKEISPVNSKPVAIAGDDLSTKSSELVVLDASDSYDPDGDQLTYTWYAPDDITLSSNKGSSVSFTAPEVNEKTVYEIILEVNDGQVTSQSEVIVTVTPDLATGPSTEGNKLPIIKATASDDDGNVASNVFDEDMETRWSAEGSGQWLQIDLDDVYTVEYLKIAWLAGEKRTAYFDVQASTDNFSWVDVATDQQSSGQTANLQIHELNDFKAQYIRIVGDGNSESDWNSISEIEAYGKSVNTSQPTSIDNHNGTVDALAYPNPSSTGFHIELDNIQRNGDLRLVVVDMMGKTIHTEIINAAGSKHYLQNSVFQSPGNYNLMLYQNHQIIHRNTLVVIP
ncbi:MAG: hypothetical protein GVY19_00360 [Bacteroidetes bacterium]|jgi:hypothetical protein|nr:hypothetical protein [Bacteroidota bacterium]